MSVDTGINLGECCIRSEQTGVLQLFLYHFLYLTNVLSCYINSPPCLCAVCLIVMSPTYTHLTVFLLPSQISSLLRSWWRTADWLGLWWQVLWPPSVSWQQLSCSARWLPALSTNNAGGSSRGKEVMGKSNLRCQ